MQKITHRPELNKTKSHSYHLCNTLSTNVLGEDKPGRYELNVKKKKIKTVVKLTAINQLSF